MIIWWNKVIQFIIFLSVEEIIIIIFIISLSALSTLSTLSALPTLATLVAASTLSRDFHFNITVRQSIKQQVCCQLFVLITSHVSLGCFEFTESQSCQSLNWLLLFLGHHDGPWGSLVLLCWDVFKVPKIFTVTLLHYQSLECFWVWCNKLN